MLSRLRTCAGTAPDDRPACEHPPPRPQQDGTHDNHRDGIEPQVSAVATAQAPRTVADRIDSDEMQPQQHNEHQRQAIIRPAMADNMECRERRADARQQRSACKRNHARQQLPAPLQGADEDARPAVIGLAEVRIHPHRNDLRAECCSQPQAKTLRVLRQRDIFNHRVAGAVVPPHRQVTLPASKNELSIGVCERRRRLVCSKRRKPVENQRAAQRDEHVLPERAMIGGNPQRQQIGVVLFRVFDGPREPAGIKTAVSIGKEYPRRTGKFSAALTSMRLASPSGGQGVDTHNAEPLVSFGGGAGDRRGIIIRAIIHNDEFANDRPLREHGSHALGQSLAFVPGRNDDRQTAVACGTGRGCDVQPQWPGERQQHMPYPPARHDDAIEPDCDPPHRHERLPVYRKYLPSHAESRGASDDRRQGARR